MCIIVGKVHLMKKDMLQWEEETSRQVMEEEEEIKKNINSKISTKKKVM